VTIDGPSRWAALVLAEFPNLSGRRSHHRLIAMAIDKGTPGWENDRDYRLWT
jgi:hypothetical protein